MGASDVQWILARALKNLGECGLTACRAGSRKSTNAVDVNFTEPSVTHFLPSLRSDLIPMNIP